MKSKIYIIMFSCFMLKLGNVGYKSSEKLFVPFLKNDTVVQNNNKLNWFEFNNENQLKKFGISKNVAKKLLELRKNKLRIEWDDIRNLKGIGPKTFSKLKKVLIL
ncbi:hypothetical protein [Mycoplasmopsis bovis]|uniref:hypothetical protein n=1 Tax=Mycoplasmopsis bovis TaxID=28903 RepID=UPI00249F0125|nr:hypothetical protein [Mycoplasmopsis bovis]